MYVLSSILVILSLFVLYLFVRSSTIDLCYFEHFLKKPIFTDTLLEPQVYKEVKGETEHFSFDNKLPLFIEKETPQTGILKHRIFNPMADNSFTTHHFG